MIVAEKKVRCRHLSDSESSKALGGDVRAWKWLWQVLAGASLALALITGGCSSYVTFRECDAEQVCRLLEQAVDIHLHREVNLRPNKPVDLKYEEGLVPTRYSLSCAVETWGKRVTARVGHSGLDIFSSLLPFRCKVSEQCILGFVTEAVLRQSEAIVVGASDPLFKRLGPVPGGEEENVSTVTLYGITQDETVACLGQGAVNYIGVGFSYFTGPAKQTPSGLRVTYTDSWLPLSSSKHTFEVGTSPVPGGVRVSVSGTMGKASLNLSLRSVVIFLLDRLPHASLTEPASALEKGT